MRSKKAVDTSRRDYISIIVGMALGGLTAWAVVVAQQLSVVHHRPPWRPLTRSIQLSNRCQSQREILSSTSRTTTTLIQICRSTLTSTPTANTSHSLSTHPPIRNLLLPSSHPPAPALRTRQEFVQTTVLTPRYMA